LSTDGRWLIVRAGEGQVGDKGRENLYLIDLTASAPTATLVAQGFEAAYSYVGADAGWLYFLTRSTLRTDGCWRSTQRTPREQTGRM